MICFVRPLAVLCLAAAALTGPAGATETRDTLEALAKCGAIENPQERLVCYDGVMPRVRAAIDQATEDDKITLFGWEIFGGDGSSDEPTRPEDFGNPNPPAADVKEEGGVITEITFNVTDLAERSDGMIVLVLENGQVWRTMESTSIYFRDPRDGLRVRIRSGMAGAFYLNIEGQNRSVQVERIK